MKATVESITVKVGARVLDFTLAEAEALRDALNDKLGDKRPTQIVERIIERDYRPPVPYRWDRDVVCVTPAPEYMPQVMCWNAGERLDALLQARALQLD